MTVRTEDRARADYGLSTSAMRSMIVSLFKHPILVSIVASSFIEFTLTSPAMKSNLIGYPFLRTLPISNKYQLSFKFQASECHQYFGQINFCAKIFVKNCYPDKPCT